MAWNVSPSSYAGFRGVDFGNIAAGASQAAGIVGDFNTMAAGELAKQQQVADYWKTATESKLAANAMVEATRIKADGDVRAVKALQEQRAKASLLGPLLGGVGGSGSSGTRMAGTGLASAILSGQGGIGMPQIADPQTAMNIMEAERLESLTRLQRATEAAAPATGALNQTGQALLSRPRAA